MLGSKALLFSVFGGDEMYVPKPGVGPFKRDLVRLDGNTVGKRKEVTLSEDFWLYKAFNPFEGAGGREAITITYPSGSSFWLYGLGKDYADELGIFLPKGTVISHQYELTVTGYYVVPASSVGG